MIDIRSLSVAYGKHMALEGVDLTVAPGEIVVVLGANGAGKSTLLNAVAGLVPPKGGSVLFERQELLGTAPHRIVEQGIAFVPEGRGVFGALSTRENLLLGAHARRARAREEANRAFVLELFPRLAERASQSVWTMSGGEQQMVALARALMASPKLLLLDEPSLGLSPLLRTDMFRVLREVRDAGVGVLMVEQNARQSLRIADRAYLLETGTIRGEGTAAELRDDWQVQRAYLGMLAG